MGDLEAGPFEPEKNTIIALIYVELNIIEAAEAILFGLNTCLLSKGSASFKFNV